jgi:hypothetical protein
VVLNFPLYWQGKIIVADFREVALFPKAAIYERHLILGEFGHGVGGEIGNLQSFYRRRVPPKLVSKSNAKGEL